jgi:serine/threonine protein kinase
VGRQPLPTNTILGNGTDQYRIDTVLGPGGFGITYLAHDLLQDRDVAVKEYFPAEFAYREGVTMIRSADRAGKSNFFEQGKRYFLEEARTLGRFGHPNIVRVINLFEQFNTAYMVLSFEEGQSLKHWLRDLGRRPSQEEIDRLLMPLLSALETIHANGMFHRDIAPDNIIVRPDGDPVLIDFGAARNFVRENSYTVGAIVKHGYSPPEQYTLDTRLQGAWSDIYSLSATLYYAIMGEAPAEAARRQISDAMLPIERHIDAYHRSLYRPSLFVAINAGLALKPKDRPQTVEAFREILDRDLSQVVVPAASPAEAALISRVVRSAQRPIVADGSVLAPLDSETRVGGLTRPSQTILSPLAVAAESRASPSPAAQAPRSAPPADASPAYPETTARTAGLSALIVATLASAGFLLVGGIEHPAGLATVILVCAGLVGISFERALSMARTDAAEFPPAAAAAAVMSTLALAVYWLPWFFWPVSVLLALVAAAFGWGRFGRWVPVTLLLISMLHLVAAGVLMVLAASSGQKDPFFLPLMGASLAVIAALVLACAVQIQRRWEPARP